MTFEEGKPEVRPLNQLNDLAIELEGSCLALIVMGNVVKLR